jgi:hypothetical protein
VCEVLSFKGCGALMLLCETQGWTACWRPSGVEKQLVQEGNISLCICYDGLWLSGTATQGMHSHTVCTLMRCMSCTCQALHT